MDERLYNELLQHALRAGRVLGVDPGDVVHAAYVRVVESGREPSPALLHRAVNSVLADMRRQQRRRPVSRLEDWWVRDDESVEERAIARLVAAEILEQLGDLAPVAVAIAEGTPLNAVAKLERRSKATWWRRTRLIRQAYQ